MSIAYTDISTTNVSVLGASGVVGLSLLNLLDNHPWFSVQSLAGSTNSAGLNLQSRTYGRAQNLSQTLQEMVIESIEQINSPLVFSCLPADIAGPIEQSLAKKGCIVISNARDHRSHPDVPIIIPEINSHFLNTLKQNTWNGKIICNPNCLVSGLSLVLAPLLDLDITQCFVATNQAVSGAGLHGLSALQMMDNIIPYIAGEEEKIENEPFKVFSDKSNLPTIYAMVHRVPISQGHTFSCTLQLSKPINIDTCINRWKTYYNNFLSTPIDVGYPLIINNEPIFPQPALHRHSRKGMAVTIGNIRQKTPLSITFTGLVNNDIRGASGNALLIAEYMKIMGLVS